MEPKYSAIVGKAVVTIVVSTAVIKRAIYKLDTIAKTRKGVLVVGWGSTTVMGSMEV